MFVGIFFILVACVILAAVLIPLGLWLGRRARGTLAIQLPNRQLRPGDVVEGLVHLAAKRNLGPGRLYVSLVCTEEWWDWETDHDGDRRRRKRRREVYRDDRDLHHELAVSVGADQIVPFALPTPGSVEPKPAGRLDLGAFPRRTGGPGRSGLRLHLGDRVPLRHPRP